MDFIFIPMLFIFILNNLIKIKYLVSFAIHKKRENYLKMMAIQNIRLFFMFSYQRNFTFILIIIPFQTIIALLMVIPSDIESLIDFFNFTAWLFYGLTMAALILMRWTYKDTPRPYKVSIMFYSICSCFF